MKLAPWLKQHEISLAAAAKSFGCSIHTIRKWLRGERTPRPAMQATIKQVTGGAVTGDDWLPTRKK